MQPGSEPSADVSRQRAAFTAKAQCSIFPIPEADTRNAKSTRPDMTTKPRAARAFPPLPDPPEREPEDNTSFDHLTKNGGAHHLAQHFGHPDTTVVGGERYIIREPDTPAADRRFPDLLIAFDADPPSLPGQQQLRHLRAGQAARLRNGDSLAKHRPRGYWKQAHLVRRPRSLAGKPLAGFCVTQSRRIPV